MKEYTCSVYAKYKGNKKDLINFEWFEYEHQTFVKSHEEVKKRVESTNKQVIGYIIEYWYKKIIINNNETIIERPRNIDLWKKNPIYQADIEAVNRYIEVKAFNINKKYKSIFKGNMFNVYKKADKPVYIAVIGYDFNDEGLFVKSVVEKPLSDFIIYDTKKVILKEVKK